MSNSSIFRHPIGDESKPFNEWSISSDYLYHWEDSTIGGDRNYHTGVDWNWGGGDDDLGASVYAIGDGEIIYSGFLSDAWGNGVIIRHDLPGSISDGHDDGYVCSFYAHLQNLSHSLLNSGEHQRLNNEGSFIDVSIGDKIAEIGPYNAYEGATSHLHFEMRWKNDFVQNEWGWIYGASEDDAARRATERGWLDAYDFIQNLIEEGVDYPADQTTHGNIVVREPEEDQAWGMLEEEGDSDWFRVELEAGVEYAFALRGEHSFENNLGGMQDTATLADPTLAIRHADGRPLPWDDGGW